jgi:hypothetical protein
MPILGTIASSFASAAPTYDLIASAVVTDASGQLEIDFQSIPSSYTDLIIKSSCRASLDSVTVYFKVNNTTANQSNFNFFGASGSVGSEALSSWYSYGSVAKSPATAYTFANATYYFPNYAGSTYKMVQSENTNENASTSATNQHMSLQGGMWADTTAINRITLYLGGTTKFVQHSTARLYGILKK